MAAIPMSYKIKIPYVQFKDHPSRREWVRDHSPTKEEFVKFLNNKYNISIEWYEFLPVDLYEHRKVELVFDSEQDYILWKLHQ